jgi:hypothetical protein
MARANKKPARNKKIVGLAKEASAAVGEVISKKTLKHTARIPEIKRGMLVNSQFQMVQTKIAKKVC